MTLLQQAMSLWGPSAIETTLTDGIPLATVTSVASDTRHIHVYHFFFFLFFLFFLFFFYCYAITVVCLFSPSLYPTPGEPTSCLLYTSDAADDIGQV